MTLALALLLAAAPATEAKVPTTVRTEPSPPAARVVPAPLPLDKLLHMSISANLTLGVSALAHWLGLPPAWAMGLGVGVGFLAGLVRELAGNMDALDMLANGAGIAAGAGTAALFFQGEF